MIPKEMIEAADAIIRERIHSVLQFETAVGYRLLKGTYEIAEAALTAALSFQWRGMGSAPKDGTDILFFEPGNGCTVGRWYGSLKKWSDGDSYYDPTHWMPLPSPPEEKAE